MQIMKKLDFFPKEAINDIKDYYNKSFHSKIFTLFASSVSEIYTLASLQKPNYDFCFAHVFNDEGDWYLDKKSLEDLRLWIIETGKKDPKKIVKIYHDWNKNWKRYLTYLNNIKNLDLTKLPINKFIKVFEEFYNLYLLAGSTAYITDSFMSTGDEDWLETLLFEEIKIDISKNKKYDFIRKLTSPVHLSFSLECEYELLLIAKKLYDKFDGFPSFEKIKKSPMFKHLLKHEEKYHWINNNYYNVEYIDASKFYEQIKELSKKKDIDTLIEEKKYDLKIIREEIDMLIETLSFSNHIINILEIARLFSKWKDIRKSGVYRGMHYFDLFLEEIANRTKINKNDLSFLIFQELVDILKTNNDYSKIIKNRKEKCFFAVTNNGYFIIEGNEVNKYYKYNNKNKIAQSKVELKGVIASPGKVRGHVKIIKKTHEMKDFRHGEILVTNQTTPEFVSIMKKAAAIITEQGGITSHAAVISRELKIPCIIGIKNATKDLINGEIIEVDADKGIIKRMR